MTKQKIKNLIILSIIVVFLAISCVFYQKINIFTHKFMFNNGIVCKNNNLMVHFISVGQGDAIAINFPSGKTMLIDSGSRNASVEYVNYLKSNVLNNSRSNKIDHLVLTHADADHIGGTLKLLQTFNIGTVYLPYVESDTETYVEIKETVINNSNFEILKGELDVEDSDVKITTFQLTEIEETNDSCPVIKLEYLNKSFLFTGDISKDAEQELLKNNTENFNADVLKVAHHGSSSSSSEEFLQVVSPDYAIISVGENEYGHPTEEVLNHLHDVQTKVLRTDEDGNILFVVGKHYDLSYICDNFYITNLTLDYRFFVLCVEISLAVIAVIVVIKKPKQTSSK